jgi:[methyl-Co(III) methanol-specific corrinoid protein]:coenzyme M methyltransferase
MSLGGSPNGRTAFLQALARAGTTGRTVFGTGTSIVCHELMEKAGASFPEGHTDPQAMFKLALAGRTVLGMDVVMPLFSVCHEAAAMGCSVNWGSRDMMPEAGRPIYETSADIVVPPDLLTRPGCAVPLHALGMLRRELGDDAAVCGKVFGGWTQGYHYFGLESFLIRTITEPDEVKRIIEKLLPVTIGFARAQVDAGADCILVADHATRDLCSPGAYRDFLKEVHARLAESIAVPLVLHICGNTADRIGMIADTGVACFHWDTRTGSPAEVRKLAGRTMALMGGISTMRLLQGTPEDISEMARRAAEAGIDIVGPECAVPLTTPLANLMAITGREA